MNYFTSPVIFTVLATQLGSPSYREREQATVALDRTLPMSLPYLEAAEKSQDLETSTRAGIVVQKYYAATAACKARKVLPTKYPRLPWIDRLPEGYPQRSEVIQYYLANARKHACGTGPPDWKEYRRATEMFLLELYSNRASAGQVQVLLNRMRDGEIEWIRRNGAKYSPPLQVPVGW